MRRTRRMQVTVEKERLLVVSHPKQVESWCPECTAQVRMVRAEEAAILKGQSLRLLMGQVEANQFHVREDSVGRLFICLNSLTKQPE